MNVVEIIEIQSSGIDQKNIELHLKKLILETSGRANQPRIRAYKLATMDTGFSIHLFYNSKNVKKEGSAFGLCLTSTMKEFGLVCHTVWIEM